LVPLGWETEGECDRKEPREQRDGRHKVKGAPWRAPRDRAEKPLGDVGSLGKHRGSHTPLYRGGKEAPTWGKKGRAKMAQRGW